MRLHLFKKGDVVYDRKGGQPGVFAIAPNNRCTVVNVITTSDSMIRVSTRICGSDVVYWADVDDLSLTPWKPEELKYLCTFDLKKLAIPPYDIALSVEENIRRKYGFTDSFATTKKQPEQKGAIMKGSEFYREWARMIDMCEGTKVEPHQGLKVDGILSNHIGVGAPAFFCDRRYEFALSIVQDRPVFKGDKLFEEGVLVTIETWANSDSRVIWTKLPDGSDHSVFTNKLTWAKPAPVYKHKIGDIGVPPAFQSDYNKFGGVLTLTFSHISPEKANEIGRYLRE